MATYVYRASKDIIDAILASVGAPDIIAEAAQILQEEQRRREQFYNDITEQVKAEFIQGEVVVHSPVMKWHNDILGNLVRMVQTHVLINELGFVGFEKIMTRLTRNDYEPDLCFFGVEKAASFTKKQTLFPAPDLVIEVLSKSTEERDRGIKYTDYEYHGVEEYWLVAPKSGRVEQYLLEDGKYRLTLKSSSGYIDSRVITGLKLPIAAIFEEAQAVQVVQAMYNA